MRGLAAKNTRKMDLFGQSPRPIFNDDMLRKLAIFTADILDGVDSDDEEEMETISEILKRHKHDDGYELAKQFDDEGYNIDVSIVCDLDRVSDYARELVRDAIKEWVISDDIKPKIAVGTRVKLNYPIKGASDGTISGLIEKEAKYMIHLDCDRETLNYIIDYEDIEKANPDFCS